MIYKQVTIIFVLFWVTISIASPTEKAPITTGFSAEGPDCPYPSEELVYFPYEGDCTRYWECYEGNSYLYNCPPDLWWHEEISQCDYPGEFCSGYSGPTTSTFFPTDGTTSGNNGNQPDCSGVGDTPVYYPYPGDCTKFWECANGELYVNNCPPDLWWHEEISECDYPGDFCDDSSFIKH